MLKFSERVAQKPEGEPTIFRYQSVQGSISRAGVTTKPFRQKHT